MTRLLVLLLGCATVEGMRVSVVPRHGTAAAARPALRSRAAPRMLVDGLAAAHAGAAFGDSASAALASAHTLFADAAAAAADVAEASDENALLQGWHTYVETIRTLIVQMHGVLTDVGVPYAYACSIFLFTLCVKILVLPLNWKQTESTMAVQKLQPRQQALKKWFGECQPAMNMETANLYAEQQVNPLAGCLPAFAQIPIFIGLYRAIIGLSKDNVLTESFLWLPTLEGPVADYGKGIGWLTENWVDGHPSLGWHDTLCYLSLPLILVITQSISMRIMTPPTADQSPEAQQTQAVIKFLPLMIGWFALSAPAGLGLYWFFNNLITTTQTVALKAVMKNLDEREVERRLAEAE